MPRGIPNSRIQTPGAPKLPTDEAGHPAAAGYLTQEPPSAAELQLALAKALSLNQALAKRLDAVEGKVMADGPRQFDAATIEEAKAIADERIVKGERPRALLTPQGWYCHPELGRDSTLADDSRLANAVATGVVKGLQAQQQGA